jgi:hypothetical protein
VPNIVVVCDSKLKSSTWSFKLSSHSSISEGTFIKGIVSTNRLNSCIEKQPVLVFVIVAYMVCPLVKFGYGLVIEFVPILASLSLI